MGAGADSIAAALRDRVGQPPRITSPLSAPNTPHPIQRTAGSISNAAIPKAGPKVNANAHTNPLTPM